MYARQVEASAARLHELRQEEWENWSLVALLFALALVASQTQPAFGVPLLLGGAFGACRAVHAFWLHWDLLDRLAADSDAYAIPEVRALATRAATIENRQRLAASIRSTLADPGPGTRERVRECSAALAALASELDRPELELDPVCAVTCDRLVSAGEESPLLNPGVRADELGVWVRRIRAGFEPRAAA